MKEETLKNLRVLYNVIEQSIDDKELSSLLKDLLNEAIICEQNEAKVGKLNLYDFVAKKSCPPALFGVHYKNGFAFASDKHIVCKVKMDYDKDKEGSTILKNGKPILDKNGKNVNYPDCDKVVFDGYKNKPYAPIEINLESYLEQKKRVAGFNKLTGKYGPTPYYRVRDTFYDSKLFDLFMSFVISLNALDIRMNNDVNSPIYATNGESECVLMNLMMIRDVKDVEDITFPISIIEKV